jgi:hypothetical protein
MTPETTSSCHIRPAAMPRSKLFHIAVADAGVWAARASKITGESRRIAADAAFPNAAAMLSALANPSDWSALQAPESVAR